MAVALEPATTPRRTEVLVLVASLLPGRSCSVRALVVQVAGKSDCEDVLARV